MAQGPNEILTKMLDRLFASLVSGPGMNCRPHASRQRLDLSQLSRLLDMSPEEVLQKLIGAEHSARLEARALRPKRQPAKGETDEAVELSEEERRVGRQWTEQSGVLGKLRTVAEDARTYEQDTGVHVLAIGFPLLKLPPGGKSGRGGKGFLSRRIVAPIAFLPVTLEVKSGATSSVVISCKGEGVDLVKPNIALLSWLEQQSGKRTPELFEDREAENPWREIQELTAHVAGAMGLPVPEIFAGTEGLGEPFELESAPRGEEEGEGRIVASAVMGLFPMANEGLLRDMQAMAGGEELTGPVRSFLEVNVDLSAAEEGTAAGTPSRRQFAEERLVAAADPCQSRAALMARTSAGLVIHGPPGTGKSQTITNIIGDHLARGQRVLMVCDKRTALDVVAHRLDYLGFGPLVGVVHDPQRDQRDFYRMLRERLEGLGEVRTRPGAAKEVEKADAELQRLHDELTAYWKSLMASHGHSAGAAALSFHDAMGEWLAISDQGVHVTPEILAGVGLEEGRSHERLMREVLERGAAVNFPENPWVGNVRMELRNFLARPQEYFREAMKRCMESATATQIAVDTVVPALGEGDLHAQGELRLEVAERLEKLLALQEPEIMRHWAGAKGKDLKKAAAGMEKQKAFIETMRDGGGLDGELLLAVKETLPTPGAITGGLGKLNEYLVVGRRWYAIFCLKQKKMAREVLTPLGLALNVQNAERARSFLTGLRARLVVRDLVSEFSGKEEAGLPEDEELDRRLRAHEEAVRLSLMLLEPDRGALAQLVTGVFQDSQNGAAVAGALRKSAARAEAIRAMEEVFGQSGFWTETWLKGFVGRARLDSSAAVNEVASLIGSLPTVEDAIRLRDGLAEMPAGLRSAVEGVLRQAPETEAGMAALHKGLLAAEIARRMREDPTLQMMDAQRLKSSFDRYRALDQQKRTLVRDAALHFWVSRQKERLMSSTLTRVSPMGADLRRRLTLRGERAMRLRQVIEVGREIAGGDPLFDMCPVWMASPETVAQIFPRAALFDVVIFDEASQCRLEEAFPVLTRGKRVVIAGDPMQLPPTRFFESAVTASEDDEVSGEQDLFERQQGEVEDLLTAALNLSIENAYLDVHYRSRNSDLIGFSNAQFYNHRLQAIPGHPANSTRFCPLTLYRANGVYEDRANEVEAELVCRIVRDLLKRAEPPSIGIACFNLVQRDLILEKLDALAVEDAEFGNRLAAARTRKGAGSFEGLFVKNLENVQGDERDHMIISTTFGPTKEGRFYQRFGPLGRAGGGRRLNVLVTRAREEVHLVTSIPAEIYRALPPVPAGQTAGGAWLLFSYLQFAQQLAAAYAKTAPENDGHGVEEAKAFPPEVVVQQQGLSLPSRFSESLAESLKDAHQLGSFVHWGNDGFCVDVAVAHPHREGDVTIGVLCDSSRYLQAPDPVEWDLFRTLVHESQGWKLTRVWTPQFFRDVAGAKAAIAEEVRAFLAAEKPRDALGVVD